MTEKKWLCPNLNKEVSAEECKQCNNELECGCCEYVTEGEAPYNCKLCGRIQIWNENMEGICLPADTEPEEVEQIREDFFRNPRKYFPWHC